VFSRFSPGGLPSLVSPPNAWAPTAHHTPAPGTGSLFVSAVQGRRVMRGLGSPERSTMPWFAAVTEAHSGGVAPWAICALLAGRARHQVPSTVRVPPARGAHDRGSAG